jgi:hypothetical protein
LKHPLEKINSTVKFRRKIEGEFHEADRKHLEKDIGKWVIQKKEFTKI